MFLALLIRDFNLSRGDDLASRVEMYRGGRCTCNGSRRRVRSSSVRESSSLSELYWSRSSPILRARLWRVMRCWRSLTSGKTYSWKQYINNHNFSYSNSRPWNYVKKMGRSLAFHWQYYEEGLDEVLLGMMTTNNAEAFIIALNFHFRNQKRRTHIYSSK